MKRILCTLAAALLLAACATENDTGGIVSEGLLTIPNVPGQWTYVSLTKGCVVGICALNDSAAQRQWARRTDWDMAVCNGMIRTNGGDSGCGLGAAAVASQAYEDTDAAQPAGYLTDSDSIDVW